MDLRSRRWVERGLLSPARCPRQGQSLFWGGVYETSVPARPCCSTPGAVACRALPGGGSCLQRFIPLPPLSGAWGGGGGHLVACTHAPGGAPFHRPLGRRRAPRPRGALAGQTCTQCVCVGGGGGGCRCPSPFLEKGRRWRGRCGGRGRGPEGRGLQRAIVILLSLRANCEGLAGIRSCRGPELGIVWCAAPLCRPPEARPFASPLR